MRYRAIEYVLPSRVVTNKEVVEQVLNDSRRHLSATERDIVSQLLDRTFERVGTSVRYRRAEGEQASELGAEAARRALRSAGMEPTEIDLLIYVGVGRGFIEPATANVFQDILGLSNATGFDVLDACASWLRAIHIARAFIDTRRYRNALILNAEFNADFEHYELRSLADLEYRFPAFTIGEAAAATIVDRSDLDDGYRTDFRTFGDQRDKCLIPLPNYKGFLAKDEFRFEPYQFISYGRDLMRFGLTKLIEQYRQTPGLSDYDPDVVFFHAASDGMSRAGMRELGLDLDKGYYTHRRFANTVSTTVPMAMVEARRENRLVPGSKVLTFVASAGVSTAISRFRFFD